MLRKVFASGGTLFVAAALVFLSPGPGHAAAHGGGFHGGGFHAGGYHFGGYHAGYHYHPYYGGYHYGWHSYPYSGHYDHPRSWGYYGAYPYHGLYPYDDSYLWSGSAYDPGYSSYYYQPTPPTGDGMTLGGSTLSTGQPLPAADSTAQPDTMAHVTVNVPAGARLWFDDTPTATTGTAREFDSPPLQPGRRYTYDVKATWNENGREVTQTQQVEVTAGGHVTVNFPVPPKTAAQVSAVKNG